jgi:Na+/melibiose symporter-like transporter
MSRHSALAPFHVRSFRFQWPADLLTSWAFEMEALVLGWYILVETGSVVLLTVVGALQFGGTLIAPMFGVASDRIGHRNLLTGMRAVYATVAAALMTLAFAGLLDPLLVFLLVALTGFVRSSDMGLRGALIAETMPFDRLTSAMSISRTTSDSARIAGALAGAGMFAAFGIGPAYVAVTACYLLSVVLTWCTEPVKPRPAATAAVDAVATSSPWRDLRDGMAHVWSTPSLLALIWLAFLFNLTAFPITNGLLPYVAREIYHVDQTGLGYLVAGLATGALLGSIALTRSSHTMQLSRLMIVSALLWQALLLAFAQMQSMPGGLLFLTLAGVMQSLTMVSHSVILLRASGQRFRGRIMGVRMLAIYSLPLGLLAAGVLIERVGFRTTATLYAGVGLIFTVLMATYWRAQLWRPRGPAEGP